MAMSPEVKEACANDQIIGRYTKTLQNAEAELISAKQDLRAANRERWDAWRRWWSERARCNLKSKLMFQKDQRLKRHIGCLKRNILKRQYVIVRRLANEAKTRARREFMKAHKVRSADIPTMKIPTLYNNSENLA